MLGNFTYHNPTKLYFGDNAISNLKDELNKYGDNIALVYGGGSIKTNGIYDEIVEILNECGKTVTEISGVMPNPTIEKVREGAAIAKSADVDFILAVGGGSVCDYSKALAISVHCDEDPWEKYYVRLEEPTCKIVPLGCVLTMAGTGSEMNSDAVITNKAQCLKYSHPYENVDVLPKFAILNPNYTMSLPQYQMVAGIYDIFNHICEQYFSDFDDSTSDYIAEGLMRSVIASGRKAKRNPDDYEARSNIMWSATWALNTLIGCGKSEDWKIHNISHAVSAYVDATHGMALSALSMAYYRAMLPYGLPKFQKFARNVWGIEQYGISDEDVALDGLKAMENWMKELGLVMNLRELGVTEDMLDGIAETSVNLEGGYYPLNKDEVLEILQESM